MYFENGERIRSTECNVIKETLEADGELIPEAG